MPTSTPEHTQPITSRELDTADELGGQLIRLMRTMARAKSHIGKAGPDGLERAAYGLLFLLVRDGPQRTSHLSEALHTEISTVSRQTSALVQHGLVAREADPEDGRACLLVPTSEGYRVFEENRKRRNEWLASVMADWPEGDSRRLTDLLGQLVTGLENFEPEDKQ